MNEIAKQTFVHGPGALVMQLVFLAVVGWFATSIASASGKGQLANMINIIIVFGAIGLVGTAVISALKVMMTIATGSF